MGGDVHGDVQWPTEICVPFLLDQSIVQYLKLIREYIINNLLIYICCVYIVWFYFNLGSLWAWKATLAKD